MAAAMEFPPVNFSLGHKLTVPEIELLLMGLDDRDGDTLEQKQQNKEILEANVGRKPTNKDYLVFRLNRVLYDKMKGDGKIYEKLQKLKHKPYRGVPITMDSGVACAAIAVKT
jgi:hypothetical protein